MTAGRPPTRSPRCSAHTSTGPRRRSRSPSTTSSWLEARTPRSSLRSSAPSSAASRCASFSTRTTPGRRSCHRRGMFRRAFSTRRVLCPSPSPEFRTW